MRGSFFLFFAMALFCFFGDANAQLTVFGGPQISSANYTIREIGQPTKHKTGFMAGLGLSSVIEGPVYFAPALYYSKKGYEVTFNQRAIPPDTNAINNNTAIHTIELAPLVQVNFSKKPNYLFLRFGPAIDFALSGTETFDSSNIKQVSRQMVFDFAVYSYVTTSAILHLGYQHQSGFTIFAHYSLGLSSLNNNDGGPVIRHRIAGVSAGWRLAKKR
ncbi:MAG TPA: porin family protein [Flavisolibacter sp.]|nr:porin family protein [Flavisolibacter sp.]